MFLPRGEAITPTSHTKGSTMTSNDWAVRVPDSKSPCGNVIIESFTITEEDASFSNAFSHHPTFNVKAGEFKRLVIDGETVMSNTPMEVKTNRQFVSAAKGQVLINGLGLGMVLEQLLAKEEVEHITVIEIDPRVIELVAKHYADEPKVTIIEHDAMTYKPEKGKTYDVVYHDIWTFISADNLKDMKTLHRKYGRRCNWQASWARLWCEA